MYKTWTIYLLNGRTIITKSLIEDLLGMFLLVQ